MRTGPGKKGKTGHREAGPENYKLNGGWDLLLARPVRMVRRLSLVGQIRTRGKVLTSSTRVQHNYSAVALRLQSGSSTRSTQ